MAENALSGLKNMKTWQKVAIAAGGAAVVYYVYKEHEDASAAAAATAAGNASVNADTVTDPTTGESYPANATDPLTGETYSEEITEYGSVSAAEAAVETGASYDSELYDTSDLGYSSPYYDDYGYGDTTTVSGTAYATNAQWAQAVTAGLTDLGYSATDVSSALGLYFSEQPLVTLSDGSSAYSIVQAALAEYGPPPTGSYSLIAPSQGTSTTGNTPAPSASTIAVPDVVGMTATDAADTIRNAGLTFGTHGVSGADTVTSQSPSAGTQVAAGSTVTISGEAPEVTVPNVVNMSREDAMQTLANAGLKAGSVPPIEAGKIVYIHSQSPAAGTKVAKGSSVNLSGNTTPGNAAK